MYLMKHTGNKRKNNDVWLIGANPLDHMGIDAPFLFGVKELVLHMEDGSTISLEPYRGPGVRSKDIYGYVTLDGLRVGYYHNIHKTPPPGD